MLLISLFSTINTQEMKAQVPHTEKSGWKLTFSDEFDGPKLNDWYWYPAYRSGRYIYYKQKGIKSIWCDSYIPNAHYVMEDGILKLRIDENLPTRDQKGSPSVSSIQTSDYRIDANTKEYQVLDKFAQKHGWFEIRCRMPKGSGLLSAFWLLQSDPTAQEYTEDGKRRQIGEGVVEIDIFEQHGNKVESKVIDFNVHFTKTGHYEHKMAFDPSEKFHIYALEWKEGELHWYIDGDKVQTYTGETPQKKMFISLMFSQGAGWVGDIAPSMSYPKDFEIDYVRVYAREKGELVSH